ncbi:MAG TPA: sigma-70 family RNA polymerase sigma factor [Anaerohalosphaeraceae bacterium]|nr:sigma-70 family RNA polymerase sigma factor [Phycisphaerae bacterium]HOK96496.1 sigma-70 family RNA polymerase sigma factor [Anaerohalosphaeraceae bacterium]HOL31986.1 sigma-70 family RNA polymerase sigma factor [Anaerohalosphaeraceae bacterium]HOM76835.1 sigma-70 family RNA polymerase sigma factor [Anaerohalosphaeraceae bacterium]HPC63658.1 sigma-70 family RNA polymerase sigma factor [Anaerohalosphaeraceae bacterium]
MNAFSAQSDQAVARAAAAGDRAAFDEIVRRYMRPLLEFAAAKTSVPNAEDIVQETFLRAYQNITAYSDRYTLKSWLFTIAWRQIISLYRKKQPDLLTDEPAWRPAESADPPDAEWLWAAARTMGQDYYTVLWLRYQQQMTTDEIAQVMRKSQIGVRVLLHRARKRLGQMIAQTTSIPIGRPRKSAAALAERTS